MNIFKLLLSFIYPSRCAFCGELIPYDSQLCHECAQGIPAVPEDVCPRCAKPLEQCACDKLCPRFVRCVAPFYYEGAPKRALMNFKFQDMPFLGAEHAEHIVDIILREYPSVSFDSVVCVPMHRLDKNKRGYNQAEILASGVAERLGIPFIKNALIKRQRTPPQHMLSREQRTENAKKLYSAGRVKRLGNTVLLVDDVMTTGATLNACTGVLLKNGVKEVFCAVFCVTCGLNA